MTPQGHVLQIGHLEGGGVIHLRLEHGAVLVLSNAEHCQGFLLGIAVPAGELRGHFGLEAIRHGRAMHGQPGQGSPQLPPQPRRMRERCKGPV
ncbi:MAG: hypothetical protein ACK559_17550, partial [bacterium]